jgi:hypothetical protein
MVHVSFSLYRSPVQNEHWGLESNFRTLHILTMQVRSVDGGEIYEEAWICLHPIRKSYSQLSTNVANGS